MRCRFNDRIYENSENGYCIAIFWTADPSIPLEARKKDASTGSCFIACGYHIPLSENADVELEGSWVTHPQYGLQYKVESSMEIVRKTKEGIIGYLSSGTIKGVGRKLAEAIYARFGMESLEVIEKAPERLLSIRGISERKLEEIKEAFQKNQAFRELMTYLAPFDITPSQVQKILLEFGPQSMQIATTRPYQLCTIKGFDFLTVDEIARKCCAALNDPMRISCCIAYVLTQASKNGHLYLTQETLVEQVMETLNHNLKNPVVSHRDIQNVLYRLSLQNSIVVEKQRIYEARLYEAETETARMAVRHLLDKLPGVEHIDSAIKQAEQALAIQLSPSQIKAVRMVFENTVSIITGGPGTGKTTVLQVILYIQKLLCPGEIQLMAPTGRAARRMAESTGVMEASTMHMAMGLISDEEFCEEFQYLSADFFNVDEFSMVDMRLAYEFFSRLKGGVRVVMIGDVDQLPSVGPGDVFRQFIQSGLIPVTVLDFVYRQTQGSRINSNATLIKKNKTNLQFGEDFQFIETKGAVETAEVVNRLYLQEVSASDTDSVQVLSPYRVKLASGVSQLNETLRELVNAKGKHTEEIKVTGRTFRSGDKIIQTKNTDLVSNGDMGTIQSLHQDAEGEWKAEIGFSDNRIVTYGKEQMENIELAYATTIHKSQGSEYPVVILPWIKAFYGMLKRNIFYTAITRAKAKVIIVGERNAIYQAIHTDDSGKRNTALSEKMLGFYKEYNKGSQGQEPEQLKLAV